MLLTLGEFVFWALGTPFTSIERDTKWRVSPHKRVGQRPLLQYVGPDDDRITIAGTLYPQLTDGPASIEELRKLGDEGQSMPLVDEAGWVYGLFAIESVRERQGSFVWGGPQKIEFTLALVRDDDNAIANRVFTFA